MPLQKRRLGPARIHRRRSEWMRRSAKRTAIQACPQCSEMRRPHRVCPKCGHYGGEAIVHVESDEE